MIKDLTSIVPLQKKCSDEPAECSMDKVPHLDENK